MDKKTFQEIVQDEITEASSIAEQTKIELDTDDNLALLWINALGEARLDFKNGVISLVEFKAIISAARIVKNLIIVDALFGKGNILLEEHIPEQKVISVKVNRTKTKKKSVKTNKTTKK